MTKKYVIVICSILFFLNLKAQKKLNLKVSSIDTTLTKKANAVIRFEKVTMQINDVNSVTITTKRVVTVLNKYGNKHADSYEPYDPETKIKKANAIVYNANGIKLKEYKKKDFNDQSYNDGFSLIGDSRFIYFDYTPNEYPYTLVYESEVESQNTAFLESWIPIAGYYLSLEESYFELINIPKIELRTFENNFEKYPVKVKKQGQQVLYTLSNIESIKPEVLSPSFYDLVPSAKLALNHFSLIKVEGSANDWNTMGKWQYNNLIANRDELSIDTLNEVSELVKGITAVKEKAKIIYEYVQNKTRYISVQLGVGGWMPMKAEDVDRLGYGDCKALTNYTKALLDSQGINSNYCVVYANEKRDINSEFASMQGNHVILNIPNETEDIWLECTSQTLPFGFIGDFTDDRDVLVIKPEGGKIKKTKKYEAEENVLKTIAVVNLNSDQSMSSTVERTSIGLQYDWHYRIQFSDVKNQKENYLKEWSYINNLKLEKFQFKDNKDEVRFIEDLNVTSPYYLKKLGDRLMLMPNVFNRQQKVMPVYENRKTPLVIERGHVHLDEYIINLPLDYFLNKLPENKYIENKFGTYSFELEKLDETKIKFKRSLKIADGVYPKESYERYQKFIQKIKKIDNTKLLLNRS